MKKFFYIFLIVTFLSFDAYSINPKELQNTAQPAQQETGWQLDRAAFGTEYVFTDCVELPKLESILNEGHLRIPTPREWAKGYVNGKLGGKRSEDFLKKNPSFPAETIAMTDALWRLADENIIDDNCLLKQLLRLESKIFLGIAPSSIQNEKEIAVTQMYGAYKAIFIYSSDILEGRDDYLISFGQTNSPDIEGAYFPGRAINFLEKSRNIGNLHMHSEIKFTGGPISNRHLLCLLVEDNIQDLFLVRFRDAIVKKDGKLFIQVLGKENPKQKCVPLDFVAFSRIHS